MKTLTNNEKTLVEDALNNYLTWFDGDIPSDKENIDSINDALSSGDYSRYVNLDNAISDWITNLEEADSIGYAQEIGMLENVLENKM